MTVQTTVGDFDVELDGQAAKAAGTNFLRVALDGGFHSGRFERVEGGGAWAAVNAEWKKNWAKELKLEKLPDTKTTPQDGCIALVTDADGVAGFVVFSGEKVDSGTATVVVIGRVTKGADVVKKLLEQPRADGKVKTPVDIRRVIRNE